MFGHYSIISWISISQKSTQPARIAKVTRYAIISLKVFMVKAVTLLSSVLLSVYS